MMLDFHKEIAEIVAALGLEIDDSDANPDAVTSRECMEIAFVLVSVFDKGMAKERRRCLDIVARKAMNAAAVRAEIERPLR